MITFCHKFFKRYLDDAKKAHAGVKWRLFAARNQEAKIDYSSSLTLTQSDIDLDFNIATLSSDLANIFISWWNLIKTYVKFVRKHWQGERENFSQGDFVSVVISLIIQSLTKKGY